MSQPINKGKGHAFRSGWRAAVMHWKVILVCLVVNLFIAFIAMGPLSNILEESLGTTVLHDKLTHGFDYTIVSDIMREYKSGISASTTLMFSLMVPMFLWSIFCSGGFMALIQQYPKKAEHTDFWRGGAYYFFRFLRLSIYCLLILIIIGGIATFFFSAGGLSPLSMESEGPIIIKFWIALGFIAICYFFLDLFKELSKINIAQTDSHWFTSETLSASKNIFQKKNLSIAFWYAISFILITILYFLLKNLIGHWLIPALVCSQVFLFFRIAFRFAKLTSLELINRAHDTV